jgi:hypothetical protein
VPTSEYRRSAERDRYDDAQDRWIDYPLFRQLCSCPEERAKARTELSMENLVDEADVTDEQIDLHLRDRSMRRYTEFYRLAWREMIAPDTERSLYAALIPPGPAHIHAVRSAALPDNRLTCLSAGFWAAVPIDYLLRTTGVGHLDVAYAHRLPAPASNHPLCSALLLRTLRLNCLTSAYRDLWSELYDDAWLDESWAYSWEGLQPLNAVGPVWEDGTPLRSERARRAALVELDAMVAVWLGVDADALIAMYRARFPILTDFDAVTWFDATERKIAGNRYTFGHGQTKEHYEQLLAHEAARDTVPPPVGFTAPFVKADREKEMRAAYAVFQARLDAAVAAGEWDPVKQEVPST